MRSKKISNLKKKSSQKKIQKGGRIELEFYDPQQCTKDYKLKQKYGLDGILASITYLWAFKESFLIDNLMNEVLLGPLFIKSKKKHLYPFFGLLTRSNIQLALRVSIKGQESLLSLKNQVKEEINNKFPQIFQKLKEFDFNKEKEKNSNHLDNNFFIQLEESLKKDLDQSPNKKNNLKVAIEMLKKQIYLNNRMSRWGEWVDVLQTVLKIMDKKKLKNICVGYV